MSNEVIVALITVLGMTTVAVLNTIYQGRSTRATLKAEYEKILLHLKTEATQKAKISRIENLVNHVKEFQAHTDPEVFSFKKDHQRACLLIHCIHLYLNLADETEKALNRATTNHLLCLRQYPEYTNDSDELEMQLQLYKQRALESHGKLLVASNVAIAKYFKEA